MNKSNLKQVSNRLTDLWDTWRDQHGIAEQLLEMYRRYGDKPSYKCQSCKQLLRTDDDDRFYWCRLYGSSPYASLVLAWDPDWTACGAYDGPELPKQKNNNQEVML
jgi:hypothetical protein